jgi:hypothetical protein
LTGVSRQLRAARQELTVLGEQIPSLVDDADDAYTRAIVSDTPKYDGIEARESKRHADSHTDRREKLRRSIVDLERKQDDLLDKLNASNEPKGGRQ